MTGRWHDLREAVKASNLPPSDRAVFRFLLDAADYDTAELPAQFTPTQRDIAAGTGWSLRMVRYAIDHLGRHGWLKVFGWASRGHRHRYELTAGGPCDCTGRVHERWQREPRKVAPGPPERWQLKVATPQVTASLPLRGNERRKGEERPAVAIPAETDHRYDPRPGQFVCKHCGRQWSRHGYRPVAQSVPA